MTETDGHPKPATKDLCPGERWPNVDSMRRVVPPLTKGDEGGFPHGEKAEKQTRNSQGREWPANK